MPFSEHLYSYLFTIGIFVVDKSNIVINVIYIYVPTKTSIELG